MHQHLKAVSLQQALGAEEASGTLSPRSGEDVRRLGAPGPAHRSAGSRVFLTMFSNRDPLTSGLQERKQKFGQVAKLA